MPIPAAFGFQIEFIAPAEVFGNVLKGDVPHTQRQQILVQVYL